MKQTQVWSVIGVCVLSVGILAGCGKASSSTSASSAASSVTSSDQVLTSLIQTQDFEGAASQNEQVLAQSPEDPTANVMAAILSFSRLVRDPNTAVFITAIQSAYMSDPSSFFVTLPSNDAVQRDAVNAYSKVLDIKLLEQILFPSGQPNSVQQASAATLQYIESTALPAIDTAIGRLHRVNQGGFMMRLPNRTVLGVPELSSLEASLSLLSTYMHVRLAYQMHENTNNSGIYLTLNPTTGRDHMFSAQMSLRNLYGTLVNGLRALGDSTKRGTLINNFDQRPAALAVLEANRDVFMGLGVQTLTIPDAPNHTVSVSVNLDSVFTSPIEDSRTLNNDPTLHGLFPNGVPH